MWKGVSLGWGGRGPFGARGEQKEVNARQSNQPFHRPSQIRSSVSLGKSPAAAANARGLSLSLGPGGKLLATGIGAAAVAGLGVAIVQQTRDVNHRLMGNSHYLETVKHVTGSSTVRPLLTTDKLLSDSSPMGKDHLFTNLLKNKMVNDIHCFFDVEERKFHSLVRLSSDVCGHPSIVHGGLTAAIMDEAFGGLAFCLKKWKFLGPGPPFTVKLEVQYRNPVRAGRTVVCSTKIDRVEGRKIWMSADVVDSKSKVVYASGSAMFVEPRIQIQKPWTLLAWAKAYLMFQGP